MSGGGRCNFTNLYVEPAAYLSQNPHFCKSALARYTQWDFIDLVDRYGIAWHEKTLGQLFCDDSAQRIVDMLVAECDKGGVTMRLRSEVLSVERDESGFILALNGETVTTITAPDAVWRLCALRDYRPQWHGISGKPTFYPSWAVRPRRFTDFQLLATGRVSEH